VVPSPPCPSIDRPGNVSLDTPSLPQVILLLLWVPLVALIHELGHAVFARPAGFRVTSFGIGRGWPLVRLQMPGGVVFHVGWLFFTGGACVAIPGSPESGPRAALFHGGGIAAQVVLGLGLLCIPQGPWTPWVNAGGQFNLLVAAWNLLPWRWGRVASDGWWLVSRLTHGAMVPRRALFEQRRAIEQVLEYETRVGSPIGIWYGHLMLAWCDLLAGRTASARERLAQALPLPVQDVHLAGIEALVRAEAAVRSDQPMVALRIIESNRDTDALSDDAIDLLTVTEARAWMALGDTPRARNVIGRLAGVGGAIGREAMSVALALAVMSHDRPAAQFTASRLARASTQGMFDPLAAALALDQAAGLAPSPETAARWRARSVGIARAAMHQASADDKPSIRAVLDRILEAPPEPPQAARPEESGQVQNAEPPTR
jgi:hypothetical protein